VCCVLCVPLSRGSSTILSLLYVLTKAPTTNHQYFLAAPISIFYHTAVHIPTTLSHTFCSIYSTRGQHSGITTFSMQIRVSRSILLLTMFQSAKAFIGPTLRHPSRRATRSAGAAAVHASNGLTYSTPFRSISQKNVSICSSNY
jgi:hypothetical protein